MLVQAAWVGKEEEKPWHCLAEGLLPSVEENKKGSDANGFWQSLSTRIVAQDGAESKRRCRGVLGRELQAAEAASWAPRVCPDPAAAQGRVSVRCE